MFDSASSVFGDVGGREDFVKGVRGAAGGVTDEDVPVGGSSGVAGAVDGYVDFDDVFVVVIGEKASSGVSSAVFGGVWGSVLSCGVWSWSSMLFCGGCSWNSVLSGGVWSWAVCCFQKIFGGASPVGVGIFRRFCHCESNGGESAVLSCSVWSWSSVLSPGGGGRWYCFVTDFLQHFLLFCGESSVRHCVTTVDIVNINFNAILRWGFLGFEDRGFRGV